jgi:hypothetical protein
VPGAGRNRRRLRARSLTAADVRVYSGRLKEAPILGVARYVRGGLALRAIPDI